MAKKKNNVVKYLLIGLKAILVSVVTGIIMILPMALVNFIFSKLTVVGIILGALFFVVEIGVWGWLANKWFKWD